MCEAPAGGRLLAGVCLAALSLVAVAPTLAADADEAPEPSEAPAQETRESAPPTPAEARNETGSVANRRLDDARRRYPASPASVRPAGPPPEFRGPDVTIIAAERRTVYEYRQHGQLRMVKIVPKRGKPYYLVPRDPTRDHNDLEQADTLLAKWVLWEF